MGFPIVEPLKLKIMLYIKAFQNYDEFKNLFGITEHGNGAKSRKNRILLSLYKDKEIWRMAREKGNYYPFTVESMPQLKNWLMNQLENTSYGCYKIKVLDRVFHSSTYETDNLGGVCADGDLRCIRYIKHDENGQRIFKMKAGKFLTKLIEENPRCRINETIRIWLCEEFAADWQAYTRERCEEYSLHTGDTEEDFNGIYGDFSYKGDFGSCMMNDGYGSFYSDAVNATAAWLEDAEGYMVARCVIYNDVHEYNDTGKVWRLAERQYASDGDESLKRMLVIKLIEAGLIDGYKTVGASCHDSRNFVTNDGESLRDKKFWIKCELEDGDTLSYQDSFKYWRDGVADNWSCEGVALDTTNGRFNDEREYDDWHEHYCRETREVFVEGCSYQCDVDDMGDFRYVCYLNEYHHEDDVFFDSYLKEYVLYEDAHLCVDNEHHYEENCVELYCGEWCLKEDAVEIGCEWYWVDDDDVMLCPTCGEYCLKNEEYFSELTLQYYCCEDCMLAAEKEYRESHALVPVAV